MTGKDFDMTLRILPAAIVAAFLALPAVAEEASVPGEVGNLLDRNGDEIITVDEMDAFAVAVFPAFDTNGDGKIDKTEALVVLTEAQFTAIDANGDGVITVEELTEQFRTDFKTADQDGDGVLK